MPTLNLGKLASHTGRRVLWRDIRFGGRKSRLPREVGDDGRPRITFDSALVRMQRTSATQNVFTKSEQTLANLVGIPWVHAPARARLFEDFGYFSIFR